jgi:hypothetical protein
MIFFGINLTTIGTLVIWQMSLFHSIKLDPSKLEWFITDQFVWSLKLALTMVIN